MLSVISFLLLFLFSCVGKPAQTEVQESTESNNAVVVSVDATKEHQTMEGFGATHLSLVYEGKGDVLTPPLRARAVAAVYQEVAVSTGNLEGALLESRGGWNERANDNNDPFKFDADGFQTFNARAIKEKLVDLARPLGFDNYFLAQKINVRWASPWLNSIRNSDYNRYLDEVAEQVLAGQLYWRDTFSIIPRYLMLFNEPLSGNRELLNGTTKDVVDIVKRVGARLRNAGFKDIKFVVPNEETEEKSLESAKAILSDAEARPYVGAIGYHPYPYGSVYANVPKILETSGVGKPDPDRIAVRNKLRDLGKQYGIPVWMTEVSHGEVDPRSFDDLRGRAIHIHDELVYADAAAYFGMNSMWDAISHELHFGGRNRNLFSEEGTIVLIDNKTVHITGMGYAIGHYARWIKRGAIRIDASSSNPLLQVSAFRHGGQRRLVLVIINNASSNNDVNVNVKGLTMAGNLIGEQSTAAGYWQPVPAFRTTHTSSFMLSVPAKSVTTIACQIR
ncbi:MAG TPA: glycoside hydrolase family 30 beta sandwich domain-containing protein [Candidatus Binatia bacterium]|jgi:O-glycosyl hydrolase|nr:glycoside hydrolase family 30 beta sandwich domain-containing protein [Candidatus Binatia bacterium]